MNPAAETLPEEKFDYKLAATLRARLIGLQEATNYVLDAMRMQETHDAAGTVHFLSTIKKLQNFLDAVLEVDNGHFKNLLHPLYEKAGNPLEQLADKSGVAREKYIDATYAAITSLQKASRAIDQGITAIDKKHPSLNTVKPEPLHEEYAKSLREQTNESQKDLAVKIRWRGVGAADDTDLLRSTQNAVLDLLLVRPALNTLQPHSAYTTRDSIAALSKETGRLINKAYYLSSASSMTPRKGLQASLAIVERIEREASLSLPGF